MRNHTVIPEFIFLGIPDNPELQVVTFIFLYVTYLLSVTGNYHHADIARFTSKEAYVFLSPEFLLLRNYVHECFHPPIFVVNNY
jgi:olfactory receptor